MEQAVARSLEWLNKQGLLRFEAWLRNKYQDFLLWKLRRELARKYPRS